MIYVGCAVVDCNKAHTTYGRKGCVLRVFKTTCFVRWEDGKESSRKYENVKLTTTPETKKYKAKELF